MWTNPIMEFALFGYTVNSVLNDSSFNSAERRLSGCELWAGCKRIAKAVRAKGLEAETVELDDDPINQDLTTKAGFEYALCLIMRVVEGGLLLMSPVCSSFVFCNSKNTCRNKHNYAGNEEYGPVRDGNKMAQVCAFFLLLGQQRALFVLMENPSGSMIFGYEFVKFVVKYIMEKLCEVYTIVTPHCAFQPQIPKGQRYFKPFKLLAIGGDYNWLGKVKKKCPCETAGHILLMYNNRKGGRTGSEANLKHSQQYSTAFANCIVREWLAAAQKVSSTAPRGGVQSPLLFSKQLAEEERAMEAFWGAKLRCLEHSNECAEGGPVEVVVSYSELSEFRALQNSSSSSSAAGSSSRGVKRARKEANDDKMPDCWRDRTTTAKHDNMPDDWRDRTASSSSVKGADDDLILCDVDWRHRLG
jgi:hypothetical protein